MQKYSQIKNKELPKDQRRPYVKQCKWWLGLVFVIMGALCDFASLSFAPQSVVMPVGSLTLVANVFFAHFWLGEKLGTTDIIGTSFIVGGAVLIAVAYVVFELSSFTCVTYTTTRITHPTHNAHPVLFSHITHNSPTQLLRITSLALRARTQVRSIG